MIAKETQPVLSLPSTEEEALRALGACYRVFIDRGLALKYQESKDDQDLLPINTATRSYNESQGSQNDRVDYHPRSRRTQRVSRRIRTRTYTKSKNRRREKRK